MPEASLSQAIASQRKPSELLSSDLDSIQLISRGGGTPLIFSSSTGGPVGKPSMFAQDEKGEDLLALDCLRPPEI